MYTVFDGESAHLTIYSMEIILYSCYSKFQALWFSHVSFPISSMESQQSLLSLNPRLRGKFILIYSTVDVLLTNRLSLFGRWIEDTVSAAPSAP